MSKDSVMILQLGALQDEKILLSTTEQNNGQNLESCKSQECRKIIRNLDLPFTKLDDFKRIFWDPSPIAALIHRQWTTDELFAAQFLNGCNPVLIKRCTELPQAFSTLKDETLGSGNSLNEEIKNQRVYVVDYSILEGIRANVIKGEPQYIAAPICILYDDPTKGLTPVAIKIGRTPDDPVFRPKDKYAWLLAKIWVRNSEFYVHELSSHLLRTHLLAEVFVNAAYRCLPYTNPLGKLLFQHGRYTLAININARKTLVSENGIFDEFTGIGGGGHYELLIKAFTQLTYQTLCLPDDLENRGVNDLKNYYYKEDGMQLWNAINEFVNNFVDCFYKTDDEVKQDSDVQNWIKEVFENGFLQRKESGIPSSLDSKQAFKKYLTMVIFTCSAQHAALNNGQFDSCAWVPNCPTTMRKPPPKSTEGVTEKFIVETLPEIKVACRAMSITYLLSYPGEDFVKLGDYPEHTFDEPEMKRHIEQFSSKLSEIELSLQARNNELIRNEKLPYIYMQPSMMENSIAI
ncbi:polyunsaturated fatty acid lipoxygenase ALOX15B-like [Protopterus annectens]|uniref:polyunsaturated fatty acid lipoxygenase ALOX15B-like n=1 Tax=Protopterus annectens TaxID=7888 RepID=UPI001CFB7F98|nr:polyunsaturated fatty acid lipoxygenase ALOX15B-like [Protopterus annectens]